VDFVDRTFVRLANAATRAALLDATALAQIAAAAYDTDAVGPLEGPFSATFDDFELGHAAESTALIDGTWAPAGAITRTEARLRVAGLPDNGGPRVDAVWRGAILARVAGAGDPVSAVGTTWTAHADSIGTATAQVTFAEPRPVSDAPLPLPVAAALLVRDAPLSVAELVRDSKRLRDRLAPAGLDRPRDERLVSRHAVVVVWLVPAAVFEDTDWPGADGPARRAAAGEWLAREGIGIAAV
jgi:hypothetical protein